MFKNLNINVKYLSFLRNSTKLFQLDLQVREHFSNKYWLLAEMFHANTAIILAASPGNL